jgi:hypothetical protein
MVDSLLIIAVCLPEGPEFLRRVAAKIFTSCVIEAVQEDVASGTHAGGADISVFECQPFQFLLFTFSACVFVFTSGKRLIGVTLNKTC